jgi:vacuolar-type H+-ATPase subunit I/STV1
VYQEEFEDNNRIIRICISKKNRQHNGRKKKYKRTNNDLQNILKCKELKDNLSKFVQRYAKGIDRIADLIPDFLQADRQMLADLKADVSNGSSVNGIPASLKGNI